MSRDLGIWIAIWLPIIIGVATAIILAFSQQDAKRPKPGDRAEKRGGLSGR